MNEAKEEKQPWTYDVDVHGTAFCFYKYNDFKFKANVSIPQLLINVLNNRDELNELRDHLSKERETVRQLEVWKKWEMNLWRPVLEYMQSNKSVRAGSSIPEVTLNVLKHHYEGKERETIKEKNAWIAEERTINKELAAQNRKLESELIEEREMRKELVDAFKELLESDEFLEQFSTTSKEIESLIKKSSSL